MDFWKVLWVKCNLSSIFFESDNMMTVVYLLLEYFNITKI